MPERIAAWDSPMTSSPEATRMDLEVVAIYTEQDKKFQNNIPSMAMVVVRKSATSASHMPSPMMKNLFEDSEKRILAALDRGLDDFMAGKIRLEGMENTQQQDRQNREKNIQKAQDAMIEEFLEDAAENHPSVETNNDDKQDTENRHNTGAQSIVEADFSKVLNEESSPSPTEVQKPVAEESPSNGSSPVKEQDKSSSSSTTTTTTQVDFAVQAAKKAAS
jgi:hypothetical protein